MDALLPTITLIGVGIFVIFVGALHILRTNNPLDQAMSQYAHRPNGWLFKVGIISVGIGAFSLLLHIEQNLPSPSILGLILLGFFSVTAILVGSFHAFPSPENSTRSVPALYGRIHYIAASIGFMALALGSVFLNNSIHSEYPPAKLPLLFLTLAMILGDCALAYSAILNTKRQHGFNGLIQRLVFSCFLTWLIVLQLRCYVFSACRPPNNL